MMPAIGSISCRKLKLSLVLERGVDGVRRRDEKQRVAVRRRPQDRLGGDVGAAAGPVLDDE